MVLLICSGTGSGIYAKLAKRNGSTQLCSGLPCSAVILLTKAVLSYFRERVQATSDAHHMPPLNVVWRVFQTLEKEVGPLGVKATIVEPDGAGQTSQGRQPGDPAKAAAALLKLASG